MSCISVALLQSSSNCKCPFPTFIFPFTQGWQDNKGIKNHNEFLCAKAEALRTVLWVNVLFKDPFSTSSFGSARYGVEPDLVQRNAFPSQLDYVLEGVWWGSWGYIWAKVTATFFFLIFAKNSHTFSASWRRRGTNKHTTDQHSMA